MGFRREVDRNGLKFAMKNNKISQEWKNFQIAKYRLGKLRRYAKSK